MAAPFTIQEPDIDPQTRTPIVAPFGCNNSAPKTLDVDIDMAPHWPHARLGRYRFERGEDSLCEVNG